MSSASKTILLREFKGSDEFINDCKVFLIGRLRTSPYSFIPIHYNAVFVKKRKKIPMGDFWTLGGSRLTR